VCGGDPRRPRSARPPSAPPRGRRTDRPGESSACVPDSTILPASITWMTSAPITVDSRCAIESVVRPRRRCRVPPARPLGHRVER
jgi:hypothetical protein